MADVSGVLGSAGNTGEWSFVSEGPWSRRRKHQTIVWENRLLLLGGFDGEQAFDLNDIWSWDGTSWSLVTPRAGWSGRDGHQVVSLNGSIYVLGGTDDPYYCKSDVWRSDDGGMSWFNICLAPWPERWQHGSCVHDGYMYVIGGWGGRYLNDVWRSSDGFNWIEVSRNCPWKARMFHSVISFHNRIVVLGGHDGHSQLRDVWASSDGGLSWTEVCAQAQWEGRQGQACVQMADHIFVMGGFGGATRFNDMWRSKDCAHWTLVNRNCAWSPRQGHAAVCYKSGIYILGGFDESGYCNDAYCLSFEGTGNQTAPVSAAIASTNTILPTPATIANVNSVTDSVTDDPGLVPISVFKTLERIQLLQIKRAERERIVTSIKEVIELVHSVFEPVLGDPLLCGDMVVQGNDDAGEEETPALSSNVSQDDLKLHTIKKRRVIDGYSPHKAPDADPLQSPSEIERELADYGYADIGVEELQSGMVVDDSSPCGPFPVLSVSNPGESGTINSADLMSGISNCRTKSSDLLRADIERNRFEMAALQRNIRIAAEKGELDVVSMLTAQRAVLARHVKEKSSALLNHISFALEKQMAREMNLAHRRERLEEMCSSLCLIDDLNAIRLSGPEIVVEPHESMLRADWSSVEAECLHLAPHCRDSVEADKAIAEFAACMSSVGDICAKIERWASKFSVLPSELPSVASLTRFRSHSSSESLLVMGARLGSPMQSPARVGSPNTAFPLIENLALLYEDSKTRLGISQKEVIRSTDAELEIIEKHQNQVGKVQKQCLVKASDLLRGLHAQVQSEGLELSAMKSELEDWHKLVITLEDDVALQKKISDLISENSLAEEKLLALEDSRIDARSTLEKASLKGNKGHRRANRSSSMSSSHDELASTSNDDIEDLRLAYSEAERAVKEYRREMRNWFRGVRAFAIEYAPELFHFLPDLQTPGSVLGDGGYGQNANLPRRRLDEYDDIKPLVLNVIPPADPSIVSRLLSGAAIAKQGAPVGAGAVPKSVVTQSAPGRHVLLRASYDGDEVVLKGFIMNESHQRKGFEREISILGKLKNDHIISPRAIVEDVGSFAIDPNPGVQVAVYIEYPYFKGGNLSGWLKSTSRKPWELQGVARQLLYGLMYLHDHGVIHMDIKPSNILLYEDGRAVLADFELSREVRTKVTTSLAVDEEPSTCSRSGTRGFMAPEVEAGKEALTTSDMYSFGVLLLFMHFPNSLNSLVPGTPPALPPNCDPELADLIQRLLVLNPSIRPTAAAVLMHPYFRGTFVERLMQEGEVVEQNRKLEAVRNLLHRVRSENSTNLERITIRRDHIADDVLDYFSTIKLSAMKAQIRAIFVGEVGVDEGGLLTEMFSIFFEQVLSGQHDLFCGNEFNSSSSATDTGSSSSNVSVVLPRASDCSERRLIQLRAFGRSMIKALYEGRRVGSRLSASVFKYLTDTAPDMRDLQAFDPQTARSLQWTLATVGVEEFGLNFESVGFPDLGAVTDLNKSKFVRLQIDRILVQSRKPQLQAIKAGFVEALQAISSDAAPFMSLLSHTDWRVMLCGDNAVSGPQVVSALRFTGFPKKSQVPRWLQEVLLASSDDHLRQFLVFVTGSPSIQQSRLGSSSGSRVEINVRHQARSTALPTAHTCFFHLDMPDYKDKETLQSKLMYAIQNATTFEIV